MNNDSKNKHETEPERRRFSRLLENGGVELAVRLERIEIGAWDGDNVEAEHGLVELEQRIAIHALGEAQIMADHRAYACNEKLSNKQQATARTLLSVRQFGFL